MSLTSNEKMFFELKNWCIESASSHFLLNASLIGEDRSGRATMGTAAHILCHILCHISGANKSDKIVFNCIIAMRIATDWTAMGRNEPEWARMRRLDECLWCSMRLPDSYDDLGFSPIRLSRKWALTSIIISQPFA